MSTNASIRVAILGGSGFGGAELLRWLVGRSDVDIVKVTSRAHAGRPLETVHRGLPSTGLRFEADASLRDVDVAFLAYPTEASARLGSEILKADARVIDLSGAYRLSTAAAFERAYGFAHPHPDLLGTFCYGLPELVGDALGDARRVASPGCFATAIILCALPVWRHAPRLDDTARLRVVGVTGSSGSGATPSEQTHHPIRASNLRVYRPLRHQHVAEVEQALLTARPDPPAAHVDFVPVSAPLSRGILTTTFFEFPEPVAGSEVDAWFCATYEGNPLVRRHGREGSGAEVAAVKGSMFADLSWALSECGRTLTVTAAIDNLAKGGAGQAIQAMNRMWGLPVTTGLRGPALWP